jgi:hypothetical protein
MATTDPLRGPLGALTFYTGPTKSGLATIARTRPGSRARTSAEQARRNIIFANASHLATLWSPYYWRIWDNVSGSFRGWNTLVQFLVERLAVDDNAHAYITDPATWPANPPLGTRYSPATTWNWYADTAISYTHPSSCAGAGVGETCGSSDIKLVLIVPQTGPWGPSPATFFRAFSTTRASGSGVFGIHLNPYKPIIAFTLWAVTHAAPEYIQAPFGTVSAQAIAARH